MQLNGIAHIYLTVSDFEACLPFYEKLLEFFEMQCLVKTDALYYCVGGRTGLGIRRAAAEHQATAFAPYRSGLHHLCFRGRSREDVDRVHDFVTRLGARTVHPPREDDWAPGYYSVLFADPDGIRLEVNFVPGKGNLDPSIDLPLQAELQQRLSEPQRASNPAIPYAEHPRGVSHIPRSSAAADPGQKKRAAACKSEQKS